MILVLGANQGKAVAYALRKLGHNVHLADKDKTKQVDIQEDFANIKYDSYDAIVSCLPYYCNLEVAQRCVGQEKHYFDLGGSIGVTEKLKKLQSKKIIMPDLGLAPGLINIIAKRLIQDFIGTFQQNPAKVYMYCGGLPIYPTGLLKYTFSFSIDGLLNEYFQPCKIIQHKQLCEAKRKIYEFKYPFFQNKILESMPTGGVLEHSANFFINNGVENAAYRTLRYPGHFNAINFLHNEALLNNEEIKRVLKNSCSRQNDEVLGFVSVSSKNFGNNLTQAFHIGVKDQFTAMQRATGFSAAVSINQILDTYKWQKFNKLEPYCGFIPLDKIDLALDFKLQLNKLCGENVL